MGDYHPDLQVGIDPLSPALTPVLYALTALHVLTVLLTLKWSETLVLQQDRFQTKSGLGLVSSCLGSLKLISSLSDGIMAHLCR